MSRYQQIVRRILADERYQANLDWGAPRAGHPEGTIRAHIADLERNLEALRTRLTDEDYWKLKLLIHTHDTFKSDAREGVPIADPQSHASLAREFLRLYCDDPDLLAMVQFHDEPFALFQQFQRRGRYDQQRFDRLLQSIGDWDLFVAFLIVDGCTTGKSREPLHWFFDQLASRVATRFTAADVLQ